jgi:hypothetical protein
MKRGFERRRSRSRETLGGVALLAMTGEDRDPLSILALLKDPLS